MSAPELPRLRYKAVGRAQRFPQWIRRLRRRNGAYVIRRIGGEVLYVGESHSGRLYETLTRHFQQWSDEFNTAGPTYDRGDVEVAIRITRAAAAVDTQNDLIRRLAPRDNVLGVPHDESADAVPF